jgi:two-component system, OmpR family, phosphate regulon sensor histidine kinase PhoR
MKKRIYLSIVSMLLLSTLLLAVSACYIFYNGTKKQEISAIKDRATILADLLNKNTNNTSLDFINDNPDTVRMTIIAPDGEVLVDNKTQAKSLENHSDREEFKEAIQDGNGESNRYSNTLESMTYYYAVRLDDGNVLRISNTMDSIIGVFLSILPVIIILMILILALTNFIAYKLTKKLIKPINNMNFEQTDTCVYDEFAPFMKKIKQQKNEITQQLLILENRANTIATITENMKEGILFIDQNGMILLANNSVSKIFNETNMTSKNILHICRDIDLMHKIKLCLEGESKEMRFERENKIYHIYFNPIRNNNEISGAIILFLDTTEKYEAEKQRREFSANVSHELKTPLTTISGLSEMIANGMVKAEDVSDFAKKISTQTERLITIIEDIIRLSQFDEGDILKEFSTFELKELADSVKNSLLVKARLRHVEIEIIGEPISITANKRMIDELLFNLIDNGIKYNKDGGKVIIELADLSDFYKISVCDKGIGIPKEHLNRVFERFYRVDQSRSQKTSGTGLGLSIVKHIVEYHKGKIEIESEENVGTTISCFIRKDNRM